MVHILCTHILCAHHAFLQNGCGIKKKVLTEEALEKVQIERKRLDAFEVSSSDYTIQILLSFRNAEGKGK